MINKINLIIEIIFLFPRKQKMKLIQIFHLMH
jgi:hypothetical protein